MQSIRTTGHFINGTKANPEQENAAKTGNRRYFV
jgi:hypothetical protein